MHDPHSGGTVQWYIITKWPAVRWSKEKVGQLKTYGQSRYGKQDQEDFGPLAGEKRHRPKIIQNL